ncbi:unnamed protein product [Phaedon cochleariae]|uniref:Uncharacterized protein n=1 Tax=Phaedon cochleariae TaxID=80249 RepID=A0A9N9SCK3_PHACE|nr:unnamed protein product [Phaedon cochleariae]
MMRPQEAYDEDCVRSIIDDVTQSSVMRLDSISLSKLWDLITMVFKWQVAMTDNIIGLTLRHLYEIETHVTNPVAHQQLQKVQNLIENFDKIFDPDEKRTLHSEVTKWLKNYNVKVSLLLRMGLQTMDGSFVQENLNPSAADMLRNLGENIYQVTQNGRILENTEDPNANYAAQMSTVNEVKDFAEEILGERGTNENSEANRNVFKLTISREIENNDGVNGNKILFDNVDVDIVGETFEDLLRDISINEDGNNEEKTLQDELMNMIVGNDN